MSKVFIDTSGYFSYVNVRDASHAQSQSIMGRLADQGDDLYTSNFVVAETHALMLARIGRDEAVRFLDVIFAGTTRIIRVSERDETRARELIKRLSDKEYSYTDATSFAIMDRLHIRDVFTLDKHFGQYGLHLLS